MHNAGSLLQMKREEPWTKYRVTLASLNIGFLTVSFVNKTL